MKEVEFPSTARLRLPSENETHIKRVVIVSSSVQQEESVSENISAGITATEMKLKQPCAEQDEEQGLLQKTEIQCSNGALTRSGIEAATFPAVMITSSNCKKKLDPAFVEIPLTGDCAETEKQTIQNEISFSSLADQVDVCFKPNRDSVIQIQEGPFNQSSSADVCNSQSAIQPVTVTNPYTPNKTYLDTVSLSEPSCRVCQCNGDEEKLISPCFCSGSVKWVHESCLVQWMKSSFKDSCEICTKKIEIAKRRRPFSKWKLPAQRPTPVLWVLVFVTAIALNLASVVKDASRLCSSTPCLVFYAVGCIGVILGTLFLIYWSKRARHFISQWVELNEEWVVILGENEKRPSSENADNSSVSTRK